MNPHDDEAECELSKLLLMDNAGSPQILVLREKSAPGRSLLVQVGYFEAAAISRQVHGEVVPRPLTHDLLLRTVEALGGRLVRVCVCGLEQDGNGMGTFLGRLDIARDGGEISLDCRPSDGIALAVRAGCPIFAKHTVLDMVGTFDE